ncbi:MAG: CcoQ/FixQ family Cbb3-type cytochrome c oxidase assembly chaperone [Bacteroidota bacterium]
MLSRYLQSVTGIENVGAVSLVVAFALFIGVVIWTVKRSRRYTERMSRLPLEGDDPERTKKED